MVHRAYFDDVLQAAGGAKALEQLDPGLAHAVADTLFMDGRRNGATFVQRALNIAGVSPALQPDGIPGPETFASLGKTGNDRHLLNAVQTEIANQRVNARPRSPGELARIDHTRPGARQFQ